MSSSKCTISSDELILDTIWNMKLIKKRQTDSTIWTIYWKIFKPIFGFRSFEKFKPRGCNQGPQNLLTHPWRTDWFLWGSQNSHGISAWKYSTMFRNFKRTQSFTLFIIWIHGIWRFGEHPSQHKNKKYSKGKPTSFVKCKKLL